MRRIRAIGVAAVTATALLLALPAVPAWAAVSVSGFAPASGAVGTTVTITGSGFTGSGTSCTSTTVTFHGVNASCTYVSPTKITTTVPAGATTGALTVNGASAASPTFTVTLGVRVTPAVPRPGAAVTVAGSAFDPYTAVDVYFDTQDVQLVSTDANGNFTGASVTVPMSATPGTHWLTAVERGASGKSAQKSIRVATSWNQSGFSARHQGANPFENQLSPSTVGGLNEDWVASTDGFLDRSVPAVAGNVGAHGVVYVGQSSGSDRLIAFDAQTGARLWQSSTTGPFSSPAVSGNRVYVTEPGTGRLDVFATSCPTASCAPIAQSAAGYAPAGSPTVTGGVVYTIDYHYALDAFPAGCTGTCTPIWTGDGNGRWSYPSIATGTGPVVSASGWVFVDTVDNPLSSPELAAYSPASCSAGSCGPTWYGTLAGLPNTPIAIANGLVYASDGANLDAFRAGGCTSSPCTPAWQFDSGGGWGPIVAGGVVYLMSPGQTGVTRELTALDATTGTTLWTSPDLHGANDESVPAIADGVVYVNANNAANSGELWAFPTTGCTGTCNPLWHAVVSTTGYSASPVIANGAVYEASGEGNLYSYDLNPPAGTVKPRISQLAPTPASAVHRVNRLKSRRAR